jgi:hypothetical protein
MRPKRVGSRFEKPTEIKAPTFFKNSGINLASARSTYCPADSDWPGRDLFNLTKSRMLAAFVEKESANQQA